MRVLELAREFPPTRRPRWALPLRFVLTGAFFAGCLATATPAFAQNKAAADVLFQAARTAMAAKDYDEACLKFDESNRADRAVGTVLNLGNCEELRGRIASSWERYTEAMGMMGPADRRYPFAKSKAEELEAKVPRLVIELDNTAPESTQIEVNGTLLTKPGESLRLDPGSYTVTVRAPGYSAASYSVELDVGATESLAVNAGPPLPPERDPLAGRTEVPVVIRVKDESSQRTLRWVTGIAGGAGIVAGGVLGALTLNHYSTIKKHCDLEAEGNKIFCQDEASARAGNSGKILGWTSIGAGALGLVSAGLFLYFTFGPEDTQTARISVNPVGSAPSINLTLPLSL